MSTPDRSPLFDIIIDDPRWKRVVGLKSRLEKAVTLTLNHLPKSKSLSCSFNLLLTNDAAVRRFNRDFRGMDKPTNVLSFPQFSPRQLAKMGKAKALVELGDIVIAYQYMVAEANKDHKILINHIIHLLIHGLLHLFGYDHISSADALRMERLEQRIMAELGLPNPYEITRAKTARKRKATRAVH